MDLRLKNICTWELKKSNVKKVNYREANAFKNLVPYIGLYCNSFSV